MTKHYLARPFGGTNPLELKDAGGGGNPDLSGLPDALKKSIDDIMRGISTLQQKVDDNDREVKRIGGEVKDPIRREELERINSSIGELKSEFNTELAKLRRTKKGDGTEEKSPERLDYEKKFETFIRKGEDHPDVGGKYGLQALEHKALAVQSDPDGGFTVTPEIERQIDATIRDVSPIRGLATVRQIGTDRYQKPINQHGTNSGWVAETGGRPQTNTPQLTKIDFPVFELYAMPAATQQMLDDSFLNVEQFISDEVSLEFAVKEGAAFVNGDGVTKPTGFLSYPVVADASWSWGKVGYIPSGAAGAFATTAPADALIKLIFSIKAGYRQGSSFVMSKSTMGSIRQFKDGQGNYIAGPRINQDGAFVEQLFSFPTTEAEDMPTVAANSYSIAFGNFKRGYLIVDRVGVRVLRDPYTAKPYVLFYTTKRVGGGIQNFEALKVLKFSAS